MTTPHADAARYLGSSDYIDHHHPAIRQLARALAAGSDDTLTIAEHCFVFVRDEIRHSVDFKMNPVTCKASDVLLHRTGYCYARSHLLAVMAFTFSNASLTINLSSVIPACTGMTAQDLMVKTGVN